LINTSFTAVLWYWLCDSAEDSNVFSPNSIQHPKKLQRYQCLYIRSMSTRYHSC